MVIVGIVLALMGAGFCFFAIRSRFFTKIVPDPKKWGKTRAKIGQRTEYKSQTYSDYCMINTTNSETEIYYYVDGVEYKKYLGNPGCRSIHIFYKLKNPNYFKTFDEVRENYCSSRSNARFIGMQLVGILMVIVSICIILSGIKNNSSSSLINEVINDIDLAQ